MNTFSLLRGATLALGTLAVAAGSVCAQVVGPPPGTTVSGTAYPYWGSAPSSYQGAPPFYQGIGGVIGSPSGPAYSYPRLGTGSSGLVGTGLGGGFSVPSLLGESAALLPGNVPIKPDNAARLWLQVPADAAVWFDGDRTTQTGPLRHYVSPPLTPGKNYVYEVRVRWLRDGKPVEQTRKVRVHANDRLTLDFMEPPAGPRRAAKD